jgi:hypothetical protein
MYSRKNKRPKLTEHLKINTIVFYYKYGLAATKDCFKQSYDCNISTSTIYSWKKEYDRYHDHGRLGSSLAPKSKRPLRVRTSNIDPRISEEIIRIRCSYPTTGKAKLYHLLIPFCKANGIKMVSKSTIGNILFKLKRSKAIPVNKAQFDVNINGKTGKLELREIKSKMRKRKTRKPKGEVAKSFGDIVQIDAVMYVIGRLKRYFIVCIDLHTRVSYAKAYDTLNSANATDTLKDFERLFKVRPRAVQTDNGLEYHRFFDEFLSESNITHYWNYPNSPKMNAFVERMNRTIQEEFIDWNLKSLRDLKVSEFNQLLTNYLDYYNTKRPHQSLQFKTPLQKWKLSNGFPECM